MALNRKRIIRENLQALGFLAPALVILSIFWFIPVILAFFLSFTDIEQGDKLFGLGIQGAGSYQFIGGANYARLLSGGAGGDREIFFKTLCNTINYAAFAVPLVLSISLSIAMLLNQKLRGMHVYRTIFFLPHITTWVAIALVWKLFYNQNFGIANYLLKYLFGMKAMAWLNEPTGIIQLMLEAIGFTFDQPLPALLAGPSLALFGIILTNVWYDVGYFVIIFLAGLQTIDQSNYEAADIDGANAWQKFTNITVPLLSPVIFFLLIICLINAFKVFIPMFIMTPNGGPDRSTMTMVFFLFNKAFTGSGELGYGAAIAFVLLLIILSVTLTQKFIIGRKVHYS